MTIVKMFNLLDFSGTPLNDKIWCGIFSGVSGARGFALCLGVMMLGLLGVRCLCVLVLALARGGLLCVWGF